MQNNNSAGTMTRSRFPDGFRILKGNQEFVTYIEHSSLRVWYADTPWEYETHWHSAVEIIMPVRGEVIYTVADFSYRVQSDEVLIIPPNWQHNLSMKEGSARYLILFEPEGIFNMRDMQLVENLLRIPIYISEQPAAQEAIRALLMQLINCYDKKEFLWNSMCYSYLMQMYVRLGQLNILRLQRSADGKSNRSESDIMSSARLFIDQNYTRELSLDEVSAFTGFSRCYFSRMFKQQVGISYSEYLRQKRVSKAAELLVHTNESIQEIARQSGFGSIATFNRVFLEIKSCTPSRYREIYGDINDKPFE